MKPEDHPMFNQLAPWCLEAMERAYPQNFKERKFRKKPEVKVELGVWNDKKEITSYLDFGRLI